jgi:pyrimidine and pyridine-specific 5'-nucleotidase
MSTEAARQVCSRYAIEYAGQVVKGLTEYFGVNPVEFETWIDRAARFDQVLKPDYEFIMKLHSYKSRHWIFTNSGWRHACRILRKLGLLEHFEGVIYLDYSCKTRDPILKPSKEAYKMAMRYAGVKDPRLCYLVDDNEANGQGACEAGWNSVHFCEPYYCISDSSRLIRRSNMDKCKHIAKVSSIHDVGRVFPELTQ